VHKKTLLFEKEGVHKEMGSLFLRFRPGFAWGAAVLVGILIGRVSSLWSSFCLPAFGFIRLSGFG
jgi:hypothetical protein